MIKRAIVCCAALMVGQFVAGNATAQSSEVCDRPGCFQSDSPGLFELFGAKKLDLFGFMRRPANEAEEPPPVPAVADQEQAERVVPKRRAKKKTAKSRKAAERPKVAAEQPKSRRRETVKPAPVEAAQPVEQPSTTPATFASQMPPDALPFNNSTQGEDRVQVVSGDELNAIDLAMDHSQSETVGAGRFRDFPEFRTSPGGTALVSEAAASELGNMQKLADARPYPEGLGRSNESKAEAPATDDSWMGRIWSAIENSFANLAATIRQWFA